MIRNLAVEGGRQVKNEDFTQYIQAFVAIENLYQELNHGDFILYGCEISGSNVSEGVIYIDGELAIFDGATGVSFPLTLKKSRVGIQPRQFSDSVTRNTAEEVKAVQDALGSFELSASTPRAEDRFLRTVSETLRGNIDSNNNEIGNIYKSLLSDRFEGKRLIPAAPDSSRYLKIGTFDIGSTQVHNFSFFGGASSRGEFAKIQFTRLNDGSTNNATGEVHFITQNKVDNETPRFFLRRNDSLGVYEFWMQSPTGLAGEEFTSSVISMFAEGFATGSENNFAFENVFNWDSPTPSGLIELTKKYLANNEDVEEFEGRLDDIDDRLGDDETSQSLSAGSDVTIYNSSVTVKNGIVMVTGRYKSTSNTTTGKTLLMLPLSSDKWPSNRVDFGGINTSTDQNEGQQMYIAANSPYIKLTDNGDDNVIYSFFFCYGIY